MKQSPHLKQETNNAVRHTGDRPQENESIWSDRQREQRPDLGVDFHAVSRVADRLREPRQRVDDRKDRERALPLRHVESLLGQVAGNLMLSEDFHHLVRIVPQLLAHRFGKRRREAIATGVTFGDQLVDDPANLEQSVADVGRVLAFELAHFHRIPDNVVLADCLEPKRLDTDRTPADFAVPQEEARRERLAADFGPAERVDQKTEHVLFAAVEAGPAGDGGLRRLEVERRIADHLQQVGIPEPRVGDAMHAANQVAGMQQLQWLVAGRQRLAQSETGRLGRQPIERLLVDAGHAA